MNSQLADLPTGVVVVLVVAVVVQLTLDVIALVDLSRRPVERVTLKNKWIWVAIILLVNLLGAILYLAIGRTAAPEIAAQPAAPATPGRAGDIARSLYGESDDTEGPR